LNAYFEPQAARRKLLDPRDQRLTQPIRNNLEMNLHPIAPALLKKRENRMHAFISQIERAVYKLETPRTPVEQTFQRFEKRLNRELAHVLIKTG